MKRVIIKLETSPLGKIFFVDAASRSDYERNERTCDLPVSLTTRRDALNYLS